MIVLDTNVLSESLRPTPAESVIRWIRAQPANRLFTTTICEAEIFYGLALLPSGRRRSFLEQAVAAIFTKLAERILPFDSTAARVFAEIAATRRNLGRPIREFDAQIAAIACCHGAAVATRNTNDFADCGITVISPWQE
jgi:toxin FitB